jgi:hypothetical protein
MLYGFPAERNCFMSEIVSGRIFCEIRRKMKLILEGIFFAFIYIFAKENCNKELSKKFLQTSYVIGRFSKCGT